MFTDLDIVGAFLDIVDGRRGQAMRDWIRARPRWWRDRVGLVAMDMSTEFRRAVRTALPRPPTPWTIGLWWRGRTRWSPRSAGAVPMICTAAAGQGHGPV